MKKFLLFILFLFFGSVVYGANYDNSIQLRATAELNTVTVEYSSEISFNKSIKASQVILLIDYDKGATLTALKITPQIRYLKSSGTESEWTGISINDTDGVFTSGYLEIPVANMKFTFSDSGQYTQYIPQIPFYRFRLMIESEGVPSSSDLQVEAIIGNIGG